MSVVYRVRLYRKYIHKSIKNTLCECMFGITSCIELIKARVSIRPRFLTELI